MSVGLCDCPSNPPVKPALGLVLLSLPCLMTQPSNLRPRTPRAPIGIQLPIVKEASWIMTLFYSMPNNWSFKIHIPSRCLIISNTRAKLFHIQLYSKHVLNQFIKIHLVRYKDIRICQLLYSLFFTFNYINWELSCHYKVNSSRKSKHLH